jgi:hypothetical protein
MGTFKQPAYHYVERFVMRELTDVFGVDPRSVKLLAYASIALWLRSHKDGEIYSINDARQEARADELATKYSAKNVNTTQSFEDRYIVYYANLPADSGSYDIGDDKAEFLYTLVVLKHEKPPEVSDRLEEPKEQETSIAEPEGGLKDKVEYEFQPPGSRGTWRTIPVQNNHLVYKDPSSGQLLYKDPKTGGLVKVRQRKPTAKTIAKPEDDNSSKMIQPDWMTDALYPRFNR